VGQVEFVDQALQRLRFLQRIEVFALDVLDQRHRDHGAVIDHPHHCRDFTQAGTLRGAPAAFAGDDFVGAATASVGAGVLAHDNRLDHALCLDRCREFIELGIVHRTPRLELARHHRVDRQRAQLVAGQRLQRLHVRRARAQQCFQATAEATLLGGTL